MSNAPSQHPLEAPSEPPTEASLRAAHTVLYTAGLVNRTAVTSPAHVAASLQNATDFSRPIQEYVTESCWHSIWGRPGLDHKTRSLLNISMLCALNRSHELAVHVRGAIRNGATEVEIREVLLQVACYCGMPAGLEGTRVAEGVLRGMKERGEMPEESAGVKGAGA